MTAPVSDGPDLSGRAAVVTGAAGAIGRATCETLAREGADVIATDVADAGLAETADRVERHGGACTTVRADVTDPEDVSTLYEVASGESDGIDAVVTVHGVVSRGDLPEMTLERWQHTVDVNLTGTALVVQAFYDDFRAAGYGKIVCVGSVAGKVGGVISGPDYVASKAGVHGLVRWLAQNGASSGVYANGIAPGPVWSPMTENETGYSDDMAPLGRLGEPEDIAEAVLFLVSQQSNWITGTVLDVNGGIAMN
jgi:NAD(P)-dependent dehydrogenase (short-subunit alcohol dehydrogenase family)